MLDRLVRPLVRTQIQILTQNQSASARLTGMVAQWLGYLGVQAEVTQLQTSDHRIQIAIAVGKPDQCSDREWDQILQNINQGCSIAPDPCLTYAQLSVLQQSKVAQLLAFVINAGDPDRPQPWHQILPRLNGLNLEPALISAIERSLHHPQPWDQLLEQLEPEVAAFVLSRAIGIALLDRQINAHEDSLLTSLYQAMR